jgi:4'-phosphopantetheinyl transferase
VQFMFPALDDPEGLLRTGVVYSWPDDPAGGATTVWTLQVDLTSDELVAAEAMLSGDERVRSRSFYFERDRRRFVATRAGLRAIVGACIGVRPAALRFRYGHHGKPGLEGSPRPTVHFNVSHSGGTALVAVARTHDVGVDIERVRPVPCLDKIAGGFFSQREREAILGGPREPLEAFFYHWTLKEAWLKGIGNGLSWSLRDVEVCRGPSGMPLMRRVTGTRDWVPCRLRSWSPAPGLVAALAVPPALSPSPMSTGDPAVDQDRLSRDVPRLVAQQKSHHGRHIGDRAESAQRRPAHDL